MGHRRKKKPGETRRKLPLTDVMDRLILEWLQHPDAADSVAGISKFWLGGENPVRVSAALSKLIEHGLVVRHGNGENAVFMWAI